MTEEPTFAFITDGNGYPIFKQEEGELFQIAHADQRYWAVAIVDALNEASRSFNLPRKDSVG